MTLAEIVRRTGLNADSSMPLGSVVIERICSGDTISNLLNVAGPRTLLVTSLAGLQLVSVADLMDAPAVCLVSQAELSPELAVVASERGIVLLVSPWDMDQTCARLRHCLDHPGAE